MGNPDLWKIQTEQIPMADVIVRGSARGFAQQVTAGEHRFASDEPFEVHGSPLGKDQVNLTIASP